MNSKLNRDWIFRFYRKSRKIQSLFGLFFSQLLMWKNIYKVLTKNTGGDMILLEKIIRKYRMGKQINIK